VRIKGKFYNTTVVIAYAPTESGKKNRKSSSMRT
jgi:hypothetical protein